MSAVQLKGQAEPGPAGTLVLSWGNLSRGDDAIGVRFAKVLNNEVLQDVDIISDYQLQIEHALDMENRERVLFVDAATSVPAPFEFRRLVAERDDSYTTHALSPQALLAVYEKVSQQTAPPSYILSIRAYHFELGTPLCNRAEINLAKAIDFARQSLLVRDNGAWKAAAVARS